MPETLDIVGRERGRPLIVGAASICVVVVGLVDRSFPHVAFSIFYVIPILTIGWFGGGRLAAGVAAVMAAVVGFVADLSAVPGVPTYVLVNFGLRLALFGVVAAVITRLREAVGRERLLVVREREIRELRDEVVRRVAQESRVPLGDIYAKVVELGFETGAETLSREDTRQLLTDLADASMRVTRLVDTLASDAASELPAS